MQETRYLFHCRLSPGDRQVLRKRSLLPLGFYLYKTTESVALSTAVAVRC